MQGYSAGDAALAAIGSELEARLRAGDLLARLGGDEFAALLVGAFDLAGALAIVDRVRSAVGQHLAARLGFELSLSAGCAVEISGGSRDLAALLVAADGALREAKRAGRDCTSFAAPDLGESFRSIASSVSSRAEIILALALYRAAHAAKGSGGDRLVLFGGRPLPGKWARPATERPKHEVHGNCLHAANRPAADAGERAGDHRQRRSIAVERHRASGNQNAPFNQ